MGRESCLVDFACNGCSDDGRGILIAGIVLHDENGPDSALFAPDDG